MKNLKITVLLVVWGLIKRCTALPLGLEGEEVGMVAGRNARLFGFGGGGSYARPPLGYGGYRGPSSGGYGGGFGGPGRYPGHNYGYSGGFRRPYGGGGGFRRRPFGPRRGYGSYWGPNRGYGGVRRHHHRGYWGGLFG